MKTKASSATSSAKAKPSSPPRALSLNASPAAAFGAINIFQLLADVSQLIRDARSGDNRSKLIADFLKLGSDLGISLPQTVAEALIPT